MTDMRREGSAGSFDEYFAGVEEALTSDPPWASLPIQWRCGDKPSNGCGGPPVKDADVLHIALPAMGESWPTWEITIQELVEDALESHAFNGPLAGEIDPVAHALFYALRDKLRLIADVIDEALAFKASNI